MSTARYILHRFGVAMAYLGLSAWAIGSVIALAKMDADIFHRFGALGVAASVLFFSDRLLKIELGRQRSVERLLHEYGVELAAMRAGTEATKIPEEGYAVDFLTEERNFDRLRQEAAPFNMANVALMSVATLQWGFGDIFMTRLIEAAS
ncbi:hypothetical protein E4Z66_01290 [Aliishimia ponticola]|uniref:Uncharacterized protein n=1 Tax=Aliishimia ponticola TaxID=2499833 RepID=A0A4S4NFD6_9RHOB|nr:hypothetical protein [Aliishimia ponticola]THH38239.1 hypothetical protein E4Z66_01290 [Aliishimia ponticola]